ncbi:MAG: hypothetical protein R3B12_01320 [Candidatus Saccharimonadales bacterium]
MRVVPQQPISVQVQILASLTIGNASNAANTVTLVAGSTNGINTNAPKVESNATTLGLFTTPTTVNGFTAATH